MAQRKFYVDLDLQKQQLKNAIIHKVANASALTGLNGVDGQIVYQQDIQKIKIFSGSSWTELAPSVDSAVEYKGSVNVLVAPALGTLTSANTGDMYLVSTAGTVNAGWSNASGQTVEEGDFIIYNHNNGTPRWDIIQSNVVIASTTVAGVVTLADGTQLTSLSGNGVLTVSNLASLRADAAAITAGVSTTTFVTPAGLQQKINGIPAQVDASTTVKGIVELADNAETQTGTDTVRAVTPAGLQSKAATNVETQTGTATDKFVTPASLQSKTASESVIGLVELATDAESLAGTDTTRVITPAGLDHVLKAVLPTAADQTELGLVLLDGYDGIVNYSGAAVTGAGVYDYLIQKKYSRVLWKETILPTAWTNVSGEWVYTYTLANYGEITSVKVTDSAGELLEFDTKIQDNNTGLTTAMIVTLKSNININFNVNYIVSGFTY